MPIDYRQFRDMVRGMGQGLDELWRQSQDGYTLVGIGVRRGIVIPMTFSSHPIILPNGDETVMEDEEIEIHLRAISRLTGKGNLEC